MADAHALQNESGEFRVSQANGDSATHAVSPPTAAGDDPLRGAQNESGEFGVCDTPDAPTPSKSSGHVGQTGPKTPWGKARSSQNAVTHGLSAQAVIIEGEDPAELEAMHEEFVADEKPQTATERLLVERIVMAGWRLRRANRYENQLVAGKLASIRRQREQRTRRGYADDGQAEPELDLPRAVAGVLAGKAHAQMVRHETAISRELYKAVGELRKVRQDRLKTAKAAPAKTPPAPIAAPDPSSPVRIRPAELGAPDEPTREGVMWVRVAQPTRRASERRRQK